MKAEVGWRWPEERAARSRRACERILTTMISDDVIALNRQPSGQAKNDDAGQDHHRDNAGDTTVEATAREMTGHWFSSDSPPRLTAAYDDSSAVDQVAGRRIGRALWVARWRTTPRDAEMPGIE
jgi:hypothetical protein